MNNCLSEPGSPFGLRAPGLELVDEGVLGGGQSGLVLGAVNLGEQGARRGVGGVERVGGGEMTDGFGGRGVLGEVDAGLQEVRVVRCGQLGQNSARALEKPVGVEFGGKGYVGGLDARKASGGVW